MTLWINDDSNKATSITISGGRLVATQTGATRTAMVKADQGSYPGNSDDWYFEITVNVKNPTATPPADCIGVGIAQNLTNVNTGFNAYSVGYYADGWSIAYGAPSFTGIGYDVGDVIGVRKQSSGVTFYKNGTTVFSHTLIPPSGDTLYPAGVLYFTGDQITANFGQSAFAHLPSGSSAWSIDPTTLAPRVITYNKTLPSLFQVATLNSIDLGTGEVVPPPPVGERGGHFPDTINAVLARRTVVLDLLVRFDFLSGAMRLWQGFGTLHTNDGNNWEGIGRLGQISDLESAIGGTAPQAKFILSGVDPTILAGALDQETEIYGRDCDVYMQFFNEDFTPLDNPYVVWSGLMDTLRITQTVDTCQVEMTAETLFARRSKPPLGMLSDREQQQFFPGDNSLTGIPALMSKTSIWPVILPQS
jgi:hypothetical protein